MNSTKPKHLRSEQRGAIGGHPQINSGRFWHSKRDFKKYNFVFENRQSDGHIISINAKELKKITRESIFENALPAMRLDFTTQGEDWSLIRSCDLQDFFEYLKMLEGIIVSASDEDED